MNGRTGREYDLGGYLYDPSKTWAFSFRILLLAIPVHAISDTLRYDELGGPVTTSFQLWFVFRTTLLSLLLVSDIRVEGRRVASDIEGVRSMEIGSAQGDC